MSYRPRTFETKEDAIDWAETNGFSIDNIYAGGGGVNKSKFKGVANAKYENNYELHTSKKTLLIDPETNKIISTHSSPYEAMKERDRQNNPNLLIHFEKMQITQQKEMLLRTILLYNPFSFSSSSRKTSIADSQ